MKVTAADHIIKNVPTVNESTTCSVAVAMLREVSYDYFESIHVLDQDKRLKGWLKSSQLFTMEPEKKLSNVMNSTCPVVLPDTDQEHLASIAINYNLAAMPIVDHEQRFLGVVPAMTLIRIQRDEHIEDLHRLTGITQQMSYVTAAESDQPVTRARHRLPWLLIGLLGSMFATYLMSGFEGALQANLALAFFIPSIVYLADGIGTQSETIAVRGISFHRIALKKMLLRELMTGMIIGLVLGLVYFPFSWIVFGDLQLALTVSTTILVAGSIATTIGIMLPSALNSLKIDPAFGSGPIGTIIQDILSLLTYFGIAYLMLS